MREEALDAAEYPEIARLRLGHLQIPFHRFGVVQSGMAGAKLTWFNGVPYCISLCGSPVNQTRRVEWEMRVSCPN